MFSAGERRLVHELLDARGSSVSLAGAQIFQGDNGVVLEAAHEAMRRHALTAQETGAVLARGFGFTLILARGADGFLIPLGGVDVHHGGHHVIEREGVDRLAGLETRLLLARGTVNDERAPVALAGGGALLPLTHQTRQTVDQLLRRFAAVGAEGGHLVVVVEVGRRTGISALHQVGDATRAKDVKTGQDARSFVLPVAEFATLFFVLKEGQGGKLKFH